MHQLRQVRGKVPGEGDFVGELKIGETLRAAREVGLSAAFFAYGDRDGEQNMKNYKRLFLVDGDSFIYKALNGMQRLGEGDQVLIFVTTEGLRRRLRVKGYVRSRVGVTLVKPGKEAVDNRIKGFLGNTVNRENRGQIFIISHDHGYYQLIHHYRRKYGILPEDLDLRKSIQAALTGKAKPA